MKKAGIPIVYQGQSHFTGRERAAAFETYLKTASGRAFAKKRL